MNKVKKLYSMDTKTLEKLDAIKKNNPNLSMSEIINAIIMDTPESAKISVECCVTYNVDAKS